MFNPGIGSGGKNEAPFDGVAPKEVFLKIANGGRMGDARCPQKAE
jgi:hypothetical protein